MMGLTEWEHETLDNRRHSAGTSIHIGFNLISSSLSHCTPLRQTFLLGLAQPTRDFSVIVDTSQLRMKSRCSSDIVHDDRRPLVEREGGDVRYGYKNQETIRIQWYDEFGAPLTSFS